MAKILLVVPTEKIRRSLARTIAEHKKRFSQIYGREEYFDTIVTVQTSADSVDYLGCNADVIIARGLMATKLKRYYEAIPIVEIPVTLTDLITAVNHQLEKNPNREPVAVVGLGSILHQVQTAIRFCNVEIVPIDSMNGPEAKATASELIGIAEAKGFKYVIGGTTVVKEASKRGLISTFVDCSPESLWLALTEAQHIAEIRREERERAARYKDILDHAYEGIIATDIENKIIQINSSAARILDIAPSEAKGVRIEKFIPESKFMALLHTGHDYSNEIIKLGKKSIVLNKIRTSLGNESIGNIITFEDVTNVQNTEIKIRSKLYMRGLAAKYTFDNIIGRSPAILETIKRARTFARVTSNILIFGDTGTGKELFAQSIHNAGDKKNGPFIAVNCAAIPENLMESEFFGYVGGAFTGAVKEGKPGFFELAHEGTIFLDELSEIPFAMQGKLLRTIQESEVMRIGSEKIIHVNTRVICATNKDLKALVGEGRFRDDLYYRLSVLKLHLPSLSERGGDILLLAERFLSEYSDEFKTGRIELSSEAADIILKYSWDGNIRELRNVCEQLVVLNETGTISASDVREILQLPGNRDTRNKAITGASESKNLLLEKVRFERSLIVKALEECGFNKSQAASRLGMNRTTLWKKLKAYKIESRTVIG